MDIIILNMQIEYLFSAELKWKKMCLNKGETPLEKNCR